MKFGAAIAVLAALAVGGSAIASAYSKGSAKPAVSGPAAQKDAPEVADSVQQPDSAEPDNGTRAERANVEDQDSVQQPDSAEPDNGTGGEGGK